MNRTRRGHSGFTLIELTLAMLILTIITAVAIPQFQSLWVKTEMQQVAAQVVGAFRYSQQRSIMERVPIQIFVDVDSDGFYVPVEQEEERRVYRSRRMRRSRTSRRPSSAQRKKYVKEIVGKLPPGFIFEFVYKVKSDDEIRRGEEPFTFYPDGSADAGFFTILRLANDERDERRIFIKLDPATGNVHMQEGRSENDGVRFYRGY